MNGNSMETYYGHIRTPADAIKLFEACRVGHLPRVQRRLSDMEQQSIKSGSVFVWVEEEAGIRRWTDGKSWSRSIVSGSFLIYREKEVNGRGGTFAPAPKRQRTAEKTPDSGRGSDKDADMDNDSPNGYRYKPDGLMKQSFNITMSSGQHFRLISYYSRRANSPDLPQPTTDPALRHIVLEKGMYPETVQEQAQGPAVTRAPMQSVHLSPPQHMVPGPARSHPRGPYPYPVSQSYNWPPSPDSTPPYAYGSYGSQLQQPQPSPVRVSPNQHPLALQNLSLPPLSHLRTSISSPQQHPTPMYASRLLPQVAQARPVAEQQARQAQEQQQMTQTMIDPRITGYSYRQQKNGHLQPMQSTAPASAPANRDQSPNRNLGQMGNGLSNGSQPQASSGNIPSISSIVHNHTSTPPPAPAAEDTPQHWSGK